MVTLVSNGEALTGLCFASQKLFGAVKFSTASGSNDTALNLAEAWLADYFACKRPDPCALPLAPQGSLFRSHVWKLLLQIPYGQCLTYGDIARQIAEERGIKCMSAQAVGGAVGHNPIAIIIPCHRVVGSHGGIGGYDGGIALKMKLLQLEGVDMKQFKCEASPAL